MSLSVAMITCIYFGVLIIRCVSLLGSTVSLLVAWFVAVITERCSLVLVVVIDRFIESMWWLLVLIGHREGGRHCNWNCGLVEVVVGELGEGIFLTHFVDEDNQ